VLPEGIVERWYVADGANVPAGARVVEVRIEGALHEIMAPGNGTLTIRASVNAIIEPGSILGELHELNVKEDASNSKPGARP
jgi:pyruvate/2-oxoglutarate dehydrogenase complex dihydrolipoamide acyltransferase (E2) component